MSDYFLFWKCLIYIVASDGIGGGGNGIGQILLHCKYYFLHLAKCFVVFLFNLIWYQNDGNAVFFWFVNVYNLNFTCGWKMILIFFKLNILALSKIIPIIETNGLIVWESVSKVQQCENRAMQKQLLFSVYLNKHLKHFWNYGGSVVIWNWISSITSIIFYCLHKKSCYLPKRLLNTMLCNVLWNIYLCFAFCLRVWWKWLWLLS